MVHVKKHKRSDVFADAGQRMDHDIDRKEEIELRRQFWGKFIRVLPELTYDPNNKRGQFGKVVQVEGNTLFVKFGDGKVGRYSSDAVEIDEQEGPDEG